MRRMESDAKRLWDRSPVATAEHPYLVSRGIKAHGARISGGDLLIPIVDATGEISSLQRITPDGKKYYMPGSKVKGCYSKVGEIGSTIYITERFSVAAKYCESTGHGVLIAFGSWNVVNIARLAISRKSDARIVMLMSPELDTDGRGMEAAREAALEVSGVVLWT